jgi:hypothetical protein
MFSSNVFSNYLDFNKQMSVYRFNNFFFIKMIDNNINFISFLYLYLISFYFLLVLVLKCIILKNIKNLIIFT